MIRIPTAEGKGLHHHQNQVEELSSNSGYSKRPRTSEDFLKFCDVVLSYANYPNAYTTPSSSSSPGPSIVDRDDFVVDPHDDPDDPHPDSHPNPHHHHHHHRHRHHSHSHTHNHPVHSHNRLQEEGEEGGERGRHRRRASGGTAGRKLESPLNSVGESARGSTRSSTSSTQSDSSLDVDIETPEYDESWGMVTCWCGKPFAGRPMIECEGCLIWLHLSCAKVRKSNIPKHFKCSRCKPQKARSRKMELEEEVEDGSSRSVEEPS